MQARMKHPVFILPDAMKALHALDKSTHSDGVPDVTRKLVHLRASQINGCSVCVDMHAASSRRPARATSAFSRSRPGATRRTSPTPSAPRWRSPSRSPGSPTGRTRCPTRSGQEAARHYDEAALAALILSIAQINVWNRLNAAVRQVAGAKWN